MRRTLILFVGLVGLAAASCSRRTSRNVEPAQVVETHAADAAVAAAPAQPILAKRVHVRTVVLFTPRPKVSLEIARGRCATTITGVTETAIEKLDDSSGPALTITAIPGRVYDLPPVDMLELVSRGVSDEQIHAVQRGEVVWLFDVSAPGARNTRALHAAADLAACLAREGAGFIWDQDTSQLFTPETWQSARVEAWAGDVPIVMQHIIVHTYADGELTRSVTLGMAKLGLPDLVVNHHAQSLTEDTTMLIGLVAQALWQRGALGEGGALEVDLAALGTPVASALAEMAGKRGAPGKATVHLADVARQEGDADNALLEIRVSPETHVALLKQLFGLSDGVYKAADDDAELDAARQRAKVALAALGARLANRGPEALRGLAVKAPFDADDGTVEWMWVEVLSWKGDEIVGLLMNQPDSVKSLAQGARVKVKQSALFDYHYEHDGKVDGDETSRILLRREGKR